LWPYRASYLAVADIIDHVAFYPDRINRGFGSVEPRRRSPSRAAPLKMEHE